MGGPKAVISARCKSALHLRAPSEAMKHRFCLTTLLLVSFMPLLGAPSVRADSPQEERRDRAAEHVEQAFKRDRVLGQYDLDADSEGGRTGHIELEGRVRNESHRSRALSIARRAAPGYKLVNRIQIQRSGFMRRDAR